MQSRLVVGCGSIGYTLVETLRDRPGELVVLTDTERQVRQLSGENVTAEVVETVDSETIRAHTETLEVETVIVAADDPGRNVAAARAVREAIPDVLLLVYTGAEPDAETRTELESLADRLVDPASATTSFLLERISDDGIELRHLRRVFWSIEEPLAIVTHDNPDPDAIASAIALQQIAAAFDIESQVCYYGRITHQENRAFINLLEFDLRRLESDTALDEFGGFALVDHSRPGVNDQLPAATPIDIVIDHHPPRAPVDATFVDLRSDVGATSTLLVEYVRHFDVTLDEAVATGLLFGIRVDTNDFSREVSIADFEAAAYLLPTADTGTLERIESPSISGETFDTMAAAIGNREQRGSVVTSYVGKLSERDALAQAADRLLNLEGVTTTVVYGLMDGVIYISGRARGTNLDLGETLRDAFDKIGSAGGHADMAGAQIPITDTTLDPQADFSINDTHTHNKQTKPTAEAEAKAEAEAEAEKATDGEDAAVTDTGDDTAVTSDIEEFITARLFEALDSRPRREAIGLYSSFEQSGEETDWNQ